MEVDSDADFSQVPRLLRATYESLNSNNFDGHFEISVDFLVLWTKVETICRRLRRDNSQAGAIPYDETSVTEFEKSVDAVISDARARDWVRLSESIRSALVLADRLVANNQD